MKFLLISHSYFYRLTSAELTMRTTAYKALIFYLFCGKIISKIISKILLRMIHYVRLYTAIQNHG